MVDAGRAAVLWVLLLLGLPAGLRAQGVWSAMLTIQPFPSPYYSDWEANPNIGSLTVMNNTGSAATVQIYFTITDQMNRVVVSGTSDPQTIDAGAIRVYDSPYQVAGSASHDARIERIASRTGRLPEGSYTACAAVADPSGFVLAQSCADFTIAYPAAPELLGPDDGADVTSTSPLFQWTPVQVPAGYQLTYDLRIVEVLPGQLPGEALRSNIPVYEDLDAMGTVLRYPVEALPLEPGKTYAWSVQALDQNGYPASANDGRSEIRTFKVGEPVATTTSEDSLTLTLVNEAGTRADSSSSAATGLDGICSFWQKAPGEFSNPVLTVPMNVPSVFGGLAGDTIYRGHATFYRDPASGSWAIVTKRARYTYLLRGECGGLAPLGGLQWIAVRRSGKLGNLLDGQPLAPTPASDLAMRFGVVIVSLYPTTTELPASFTEARDFLDYHDIDIQPGVNAFAVVDLKEHRLWPLFQALGYGRKSVELQGFLGVNTAWSIGGRITRASRTKGSVEISAQRTFLDLRASLGERRPTGVLARWFATSQVGLEFVAQDSAAYRAGSGGTGSRAALDLILQAVLTMTDSAGRQWHGSIGVDLTQEHQAPGAYAKDQAAQGDSAKPFVEGCGKEKIGDCFKYVLKLGVDQWQPLARLPVHLSDVELEMDINDGFLHMLVERDPGYLDWSVVGTAGFGVGNQADLGKIILGLGRSADSVQAAATSSEIGVGSNSPVMGPAPRPTGNTRPPRRPKDRMPPGQAAPAQAPAEGQAPRTSQPQPLEPAQKESGKLKWGVRIALGNMSLQDLIRLITRSLP